MRSVWITSKSGSGDRPGCSPTWEWLHKGFAESLCVRPQHEEACSAFQVKGSMIKQGPAGLATESESCPGLLCPCCVTLEWLQPLWASAPKLEMWTCYPSQVLWKTHSSLNAPLYVNRLVSHKHWLSRCCRNAICKSQWAREKITIVSIVVDSLKAAERRKYKPATPHKLHVPGTFDGAKYTGDILRRQTWLALLGKRLRCVPQMPVWANTWPSVPQCQPRWSPKWNTQTNWSWEWGIFKGSPSVDNIYFPQEKTVWVQRQQP